MFRGLPTTRSQRRDSAAAGTRYLFAAGISKGNILEALFKLAPTLSLVTSSSRRCYWTAMDVTVRQRISSSSDTPA